MKKIIFLGILLRLILMPFSTHPDIRGHYLGGYLIAEKNALFNVYDYISQLPRTNPIARLYGDDFLVYSPLTYLSHAVFLKILPIPHKLFDLLILDMGQAKLDSNFPWLMFLLKSPYLFVDLGFLWFLIRIVDSKNRYRASILWSFNLPLIYSAFLMGQFDIFLVLSFAASLYFIVQKKYSLAAVSLAIGAGFKPFPIFLLPFIPGNKLKNIFFGLLTYLIIITPYLPSPAYRMYALMAQQSDKMWYAKIMVSGSQYLPIFLVGFVLLFWVNHFLLNKLPYWGWSMSVLLLFYSVTHYHPQWFSWISPFLILALINYKKSTPLIATLLLCHLLVILSFDSSLNFGLFDIDYRLNISDQFISLIRGSLAATSMGLYFLIQNEFVVKKRSNKST